VSRKDQVCKELRAKVSELHAEAESQASKITKLSAESNRWKTEANRAKMHLSTLKDRVEERAKQAQAVRQGEKRPAGLAKRVTDRSQLVRRSTSPQRQESIVRANPASSSFHLPEPLEPLLSPRIPNTEPAFEDREDLGAAIPSQYQRNDESRQESEWWGGPGRWSAARDEAPMRTVRWSTASEGHAGHTSAGVAAGRGAAGRAGIHARGPGQDPEFAMPSEIHGSPSRAVADTRSSVDLSESEIAALEDTIRILNLSKEEAADLFMAQFEE